MQNLNPINPLKTEENSRVFDRIYIWAQLNFKIQTIIQNNQFSQICNTDIDKLGFTGELPKSSEELHNKKCFFSAEATGNRIATLAIKEAGENIYLLEWAEEGVKHAYIKITQENPNPLLEKSLFKSLEILSIFKP